jgi:hypothetical protein
MSIENFVFVKEVKLFPNSYFDPSNTVNPKILV